MGIAIGLPAAMAATRPATGLLFGIDPADPYHLAAATALMASVAAWRGSFPRAGRRRSIP